MTNSSFQMEEDQFTSPSTQENKKFEGKLKIDSTGEQSGIYWGLSALVVFPNGLLMV